MGVTFAYSLYELYEIGVTVFCMQINIVCNVSYRFDWQKGSEES